MKTVASMTLALVATTAFAKPILWYHFDEKAPGTYAPGAVAGAIVNAANPGTLNGTVRGLKWNSTVMTDNQRLRYTNALDVATTWYDPATGTKGDTTGFFVEVAGPSTGTGASGLVTVPDDAALHLDKFTVEFFFRKEPNSIFPTQVLPIQLYNSNGNTFAWQIRLTKEYDKLNLSASKRDNSSSLSTNFTVGTPFSDCRWHHVALTYDGTSLCLYYDYKLLGTKKWTVEYATNPADAILAIGNSPREKWGRYHGWMDEVRISDEVLPIDQFLRPMPLHCDEDTLVYVSGKTAGLADFGGFGKTNNLNEVWKGQTAVPTKMYEGRLPAAEEVVPSAAVRSDLFATNIVGDTSSLFFETNAAATQVGRTARIEIADVVNGKHALLTNDALTVEFFIKPSPQAPDCNNNKYLIGCHTGTGCQTLLIRKAKDATNGAAQWAVYDEDGVAHEHISGKNLRDGNWHHLAVVQDTLRRECSLYVDYALDKIFTNVVVDASAHTGSCFKPFNFCAAYNGSQPTGYRGWMDEIRITRRALQPTEFLSTRDVPAIAKVGGKQVLFYAPFDADAKAYPFPDDSVGAVTKGTFDTASRPLEEIEARAAMCLATTNAASLLAKGGSVTYDDAATLAGCQSMTIEFYANAPEAGDWTPFVRYEGDKVAFQVAKAPDGRLSVMVGTDKIATGYYIKFDSTKLLRHTWHHYAVTLERKVVEDEVVTEVRAYADHVELALAPGETTRLFPGEIPSRLKDMKIYLGRAKTWASLTGAIDEVRITEGVLGVENFLDLCPSIGVLLMFR